MRRDGRGCRFSAGAGAAVMGLCAASRRRDSGALVGGDDSSAHRLGCGSWVATASSSGGRWRSRRRRADRLPDRSWAADRAGELVAAPLAERPHAAAADDRRQRSSIPFTLTAALSDPRRLTDAGMGRDCRGASRRLAGCSHRRGSDPDRLTAAAARRRDEPLARAILPWMIVEEPERLARAVFADAARAAWWLAPARTRMPGARRR